MRNETTAQISSEVGALESPAGRAGLWLFLTISLFYWLTLSPFVDLSGSGPALNQANRASSSLTQIVSILLFACSLGYGFLHPMRRIMFQPRILLSVILLWILFTATISGNPVAGYKGAVLAIIATANAGAYLLLPRSERQFAKLLAASSLILLAVAYMGVVLYPSHAIHQASEVREPLNAGFWRGPFRHKNDAAVAMVMMVFFGLFVMKSYSRFAGLLIVVLAAGFLLNTGGKTAMAMLPAAIVLSMLFEHVRVLRVPVVVGGLVLLNTLALGSAVSAPVYDFIAGLGIDPTFTNRTDVWRIALPAAAEEPIFGHGLRGYWQTSGLLFSGNDIETWAVAAAHAHNSYLDSIIALGVPGLVLTLLWILILPFTHVSRMAPDRMHTPLTRLFLRIWIYVLFHASLESFFYNGSSPIWFTFLFAIYGLQLQSSALLTRTAPDYGRKEEYTYA